MARQRSSIDLDDFERRLRQTQHSHARGPANHEDDPLAELARIVGDDHDPYGDVFALQPAPTSSHHDLRPAFAPHARREPSFDEAKPRFAADFAAIEAGLRSALDQPHASHDGFHAQDLHPQVAPGHDAQPDFAEPDYAFPPEPQVLAQDASWAAPANARAKRGFSMRRPAVVIGGSIAVAVVGIGVAFAYKGVGSSPREIKTIMAAAGPTKVQPPADATADADQNAALGAQQQAPTKLVSREEQPVDLQQAVQDNAARDASGRDANAESVPVPPSPAQADGTASQANDAPAAAAYGDQGFGVGMPVPKKVKSVMVKPDGTIVPSAAQDDASALPAAAPAKAPDRIAALVDGATPAPATVKGKAAKAKATARVAASMPAASADDQADADDAPKPAKKAKTSQAKPVHVATAETGTEPTADAAAGSGEAARAEGTGAYAVQLAAPGSEADAKSATTRLLKKFAAALHGRHIGFHRADSNGKTVYRVRVASLSKEDATSLCSKLKSSGGTCFVAKN